MDKETDPLRFARNEGLGEPLLEFTSDLIFEEDKLKVKGSETFLRTPYGDYLELKNDGEKRAFAQDSLRYSGLWRVGDVALGLHGAGCNLTLFDLLSYRAYFERFSSTGKKVGLAKNSAATAHAETRVWRNALRATYGSTFPVDLKKTKDMPVKKTRGYFDLDTFSDEWVGEKMRHVFGDETTARQLTLAQQAATCAIGSFGPFSTAEAHYFVVGGIAVSYFIDSLNGSGGRFATWANINKPTDSLGDDWQTWVRQQFFMSFAMDDFFKGFAGALETALKSEPPDLETLRRSVQKGEGSLPFPLRALKESKSFPREFLDGCFLSPIIPLWNGEQSVKEFEQSIDHWFQDREEKDQKSEEDIRYRILPSVGDEYWTLMEETPTKESRPIGIYIQKPAVYARYVERNLYFIKEFLEVFDSERSDLVSLIKRGEGTTLEFKETLRYSITDQQNSKVMFEETIKTVAAFLNTAGGKILLGVADNGEIKGLDLKKEGFKSLDKTKLHMNNLISKRLGDSVLTNFVEYDHHMVGDKPVVIIECWRSPETVYYGDEVWVRVPAGKKQLSAKEAIEWQKNRNLSRVDQNSDNASTG
jgi:hypothetical protein